MRVRRDYFVGLFFLVFAIMIIWITPKEVSLSQGGRYISGASARSFPNLLAISMTILSITLLIDAKVKALREKKKNDLNYDREQFMYLNFKTKDFSSLKRIFFVLLSFLVYIKMILFLGFFSSSILYLMFSMKILGVKKWITILLITFSVNIVLYFFFIRIMKIPMPQGLII